MNVLVDTGVWYSFIDQREMINDRAAIESLFEGLQFALVLMPWPVVYETIRTRLSKNRIALNRLQIALERPNIVHVDDAPYREDALQMVFALVGPEKAATSTQHGRLPSTFDPRRQESEDRQICDIQ